MSFREAGVSPDSFHTGIESLKAVAEPTRFRLLALLEHGDLSVKDLTTILGQSQPRLSRHLKLLTDAGWITRFPEGAWVYYRLADGSAVRSVWQALRAHVGEGDAVLGEDAARLERLKADQKARAQAFFQDHAARWDSLRKALVPEADVEAAIVAALGTERVDSFLDVGTGTGRMLVLLADLYARGIGIDTSHAMLQVARAAVAEHGLEHAQMRHGDMLTMGLPRDSQDLVALHQVMHFFDDPRGLLAEARRVLAPGGRMLVVDFAPHAMESLRTDHQHRRLGFAGEEVARWLEAMDLHVEPVLRLGDGRASEAGLLTVNLWLARDRRVRFDAPAASTQLALA